MLKRNNKGSYNNYRSILFLIIIPVLTVCGLEDYPYLYPNARLSDTEDPVSLSFGIPKEIDNQNLDSIFFKGYKLLYKIYPKKESSSYGPSLKSDELAIENLNQYAQTAIAIRIQDELAFKTISYGKNSDGIELMDSPLDVVKLYGQTPLTDEITVIIDMQPEELNYPIIKLEFFFKDNTKILRILRLLRNNGSEFSFETIKNNPIGDFIPGDEYSDYDSMEIVFYVVTYGINMYEGASTIFSEAKRIGLLELPY